MWTGGGAAALLEEPMKGEAASGLRDNAIIGHQDESAAVIRHDARDLPLADESVDLIVTSPP